MIAQTVFGHAPHDQIDASRLDIRVILPQRPTPVSHLGVTQRRGGGMAARCFCGVPDFKTPVSG
jgi:hypothetical protein